jgi:hypothetical protein
MRLDPEEQIIRAALDQAELDDANERGVAARIEFRPGGHAKVTFIISREFVETARALDWTTGELVAEAIGMAIPRSGGEVMERWATFAYGEPSEDDHHLRVRV